MTHRTGLCQPRLSRLVTTLLCFLLLLMVQSLAARIEKMEITESGEDMSTMEETYQTNILDNSNILNADTSVRFTHKTTVSSLEDELTKQPGPSACSQCDEMLPPPISFEDEDGQKTPESRLNYRQGTSAPTCRINGTVANFTNCNLSSIPTKLPTNITQLLLGHNLLTDDSLYRGVFKNYSKLILLSLSTNKITSLPDGVFEGLQNLKCLCLQYNPIKMDENLNSSLVFQPLEKSLRYLRLNGINKNTANINLTYPSYALSFLSNLKYLFIDGIPLARFENPRQQFTKLTHLVMAGFRYGYCNLVGLKSQAFEFTTLTHLDVSDCGLHGGRVHESAFENLQNLRNLILSNNFDLGIQNVGHLMYGQRNNKNLRSLVIQRINPRFSPCIVLYAYTLRHFANTSLEIIQAMDNKIEIIERGAMQLLPKTLKLVDLTNNKIIFGDYIRDLGTLTGLSQLILDRSRKSYRFPNVYPVNLLANCMGNYSYSEIISKASLDIEEDVNIKEIAVPPNLTHLSMYRNGLVYNLNNMTFSTPNKLLSVDLTLNIFRYLDGPVRGLTNLENLKLDTCLIKYISCHFFDEFPNLKYLSLSQNQLGNKLSFDTSGCIFKNLKSVTSIDLSLNGLFSLQYVVFKNMSNLEYLDLSQNRLSKLNFCLSHMKKLNVLDLQKNQIQFFTPQTMKDIDEIRKGRDPPQINLSFNPISCSCDHLDFLVWFSDNFLVHTNFTADLYFCSGVRQPRGYEEVIARLRRECIKQNTLFAVVISATMVAVLAMLVVLTYRFRWTLRYWYNAARLKLQPVSSPDDFEFDVFVSYSDKDDFVEEELIPRLQDEFNLKVMMHGLCFPAGGHITDSIHMAVTTSRKTLVVITKNMLNSHWCNYELMMARRESIRRGRQVLVFLFLEDLNNAEMTPTIASYIRESTYIAYPPDPCHRPVFWRKLADDLGADIEFN